MQILQHHYHHLTQAGLPWIIGIRNRTVLMGTLCLCDLHTDIHSTFQPSTFMCDNSNREDGDNENVKVNLNHVEGDSPRLEDWLQHPITREESASKQKIINVYTKSKLKTNQSKTIQIFIPAQVTHLLVEQST